MKRLHFGMSIAIFIALALVLNNCTPVPITTPEPTQAPSQEPVATEPPTEPPTKPPTEQPALPTQSPAVTRGWSSHASTKTALSFRHPGEWYGPAPLPFGEGVYIKDPDKQIGVIIQIELAGDPAALVAAWGATPIKIIGLLDFTPETATDGAPVTVSRIESATKIAKGGGLTAQAAYFKRPKDVMSVIWYATNDQWEAMQETFMTLLNSIEIWQSYSNGQYGLLTIYLHDWAKPEAPWVNGGGIWLHSKNGDSGMVIWMREIADPLALLAAWTPEPVFGPNRPTCSPPAPGDRMSAMHQEWESKTGTCTNDAGSELTYEVAFLPNRDRVLEIVVYTPTGQWEYATGIFKTMLSLLTDIR